MSKDWTDKLPSLLEDYEESAPEGLWDAVLDGMAGRKKRMAAFWWIGGGILSAAAAVVLAVFLWKPAAQPATVSSVPETMIAETLREKTEADAPVTEAEPGRYAQPEIPATKAAEKTTAEQEATPQPDEQAGTEALSEDKPKTDKTSEPEVNQEGPSKNDQPSKPEKETPVRPSFESTARKKPASARRIQLRLSSGNYLAQAANELFQGYGVPYNPGMAMSTKSGEDGEITVPMLSRNRESSTEARHRQLFRVQLGISYPFSQRWSIGSGISYSLLQSEYSTVSGETRTLTTRQLHYLGVPLTIQFKALEFKRLSIIAEAGPMFETAIGSNVWTNSYVGEMPASRQLDFVEAKDFQWSLTAGLGVQYQLFRYGALFVQPGLSWHLAGSGNVESIYTQRPLAFDLSFGYRFTF
ncbi:MAG: outer membrane beta-barrel protein [Bacteroidales bacterium]|nr:outer membrane beta-barrel protein [Bacteroidales bacterium]